MKLTVGEILIATGGRLEAGSFDGSVSGVSTDTRTLKPGDLFVALKGETHDGHDHVSEAVKKGASAVLIQRLNPILPRHIIVVLDTLKALGDLARYWRRKFAVPVVGVTGSNGKTTVKDLIAAVLATRYRVIKTEGNFNNLVGLPLTVFRMKGDEEVAVLEMGMNRPGEIDRLSEIAAPSVGVITSVARAHLEGLGSLANVAKAKGEILDRLPAGGLAVLPFDNPYFSALSSRARSRGVKVAGFGQGAGSDYRELSSRIEEVQAISFDASWDGRRASFRMPVAGRHNAVNALAALAVGAHFQVPLSGVRRAMAKFKTGAKRMEIMELTGRGLAGGVQVINDCYNANPDSTIASLDFLRDLALWKRRGSGSAGSRSGGAGRPPAYKTVAVLGEMLELGRFAGKLHEEVGSRAARSDVGLLIAVGPHADATAAGARRSGLPPSRVFALSQAGEAVSLLRSSLREGDLLLVKGSRGMKMERVVEGLGKGLRGH